jgi:flagellar basal-body rod modification protein FlgD
MTTDAISGSSASTNAANAADLASRVPTQQLGQADFLQLLVTQMSSQDPLNPQSDTEFISQMAQFSSLQNSKDLQTQMEAMRATQLIGQTVTVKVHDDQGDRSDAGVVTGLSMDTGTPQVVLNNGSAYDVSDITLVQQTPQTPTQQTLTGSHYAN